MNTAPSMKLKPTARFTPPALPKPKAKAKGRGYADGGTTQQITNISPQAEGQYGSLLEQAGMLTGVGTDAAGNPYPLQQRPEYGGQRDAQFSNLQKQAYQGIGGLGVSGQTGQATSAAGTATDRALGVNYNPSTFQTYGSGPQQVSTYGNAPQQTGTQSFLQPGTAGAYMNPYMQNVVDIQKREATRADDVARTGRNAQAVGAGAFGGSRQAIQEAEANRNLQTRLGDIQATGSDAAFKQAQQQFNAEQGLGLQSQMANQQAGLNFGNQYLQGQMANQNAGLQFGNQFLQGQQLGEQSKQFGANLGLQGLNTAMQGAQTLGGLGNDQFKQQYTTTMGQSQLGGEQQANAQKILDTQYNDFQTAQNYPYQQLGFMADILRGTQGTSRTMYETQAQPSNLQTLAGLASIYSGANKMGMFGSAKGGTVPAVERGLASIAPDSVGDFADGGIVGYAEAGSIDPQIAADREMYGRWWDATKDASARGGAAIADVGLLVPRGLAGAYDTAVVRPMRAAGLPAGYLSKHLMPEGGDPGSQTPFYDRYRTADAPTPALPTKAATAKKDDETLLPKAEEPVTAGGRSGLAALLGGGPSISAGKAPTMDETLANRKRAGTGLDTVRKEGIASLIDVAGAEREAAEADAADVDARIAKRGVAGAEREKKLQGRIDEMGGRTERAQGDALIQAGLGILMAKPGGKGWRGALAPIAAGAKSGFDQFRGDEEKLRAERAKLDDSMDALLEARRLEADADEKERGAARKMVRGATVTAKKNMASFLNEVGLKEVAHNDAMFNTFTKTYSDWQTRDMTAQAHNASERTKLGVASLMYGGAGGGKPMTPDQYNDNIRQATDQLLKQGVGPDGKLWTQQTAVAEAKRQVDAIRTGQSPYSLAPQGVRMTMTP